MATKKYFKFKQPENLHQLQLISPYLLKILAYVVVFGLENGLDITITSAVRTPEENQQVGAVSMTHVDGRALDISVKQWPLELIKQLEAEVNFLFKDIGAISSKTGRPVPFLFHDGTAPHIHLQVRPI